MEEKEKRIASSENSICMPSSDDKLEYDERQVIELPVLGIHRIAGGSILPTQKSTERRQWRESL
jgi:hypothetical protein